jgi:hypothetical protein
LAFHAPSRGNALSFFRRSSGQFAKFALLFRRRISLQTKRISNPANQSSVMNVAQPIANLTQLAPLDFHHLAAVSMRPHEIAKFRFLLLQLTGDSCWPRILHRVSPVT